MSLGGLTLEFDTIMIGGVATGNETVGDGEEIAGAAGVARTFGARSMAAGEILADLGDSTGADCGLVLFANGDAGTFADCGTATGSRAASAGGGADAAVDTDEGTFFGAVANGAAANGAAASAVVGAGDNISGDAAETTTVSACGFAANRSPNCMSNSPRSRRWFWNKNAPAATAETKSPVANPRENALNGLGACDAGKSIAGGIEPPGASSGCNRLPPRGNASDRGPADAAPSSGRSSTPGWLIQLRILSRASAGKSMNRKPPFCVSSVHVTAPAASIRWLLSENQKRIVPFGGTGSKE